MTAPLLSFPTSVIPQSAVLSLSSIVGRSASPFTFEEQLFKWPGERWEAEIQMPPIVDADDADEWTSFLLSLQGSYGRFTMGDPTRPTNRGTGGGTPVVDGAANAGYTLAIRGATALVTNWLRAGDYFQLLTGASSQLHRLTANANTDSGGRTTLTFTPQLRITPADGSTVNITTPKGVFRLDNDTVSWSTEPGNIVRIGFRAVEAI